MPDSPVPNRIEKSIEINAPVSRVWQALTDYREFSEWFRVVLEKPFEAGKPANGRSTLADHTWEALILKMEPERYFSLSWGRDHTKDAPTLVEFTLEETAMGTLLRVVESGFDAIPIDRRAAALRAHEDGWVESLKSIARYLEHAPKQAMAS